MQKVLTSIVTPMLAAGILLVGHCLAQDTPAGSQTGQTPSKSSTTTPKASTTKKATTGSKTTTGAKTTTGVTLTTKKDKNSYALGMSIGMSMKKQGVAASVDPAMVARGLRDAMGSGKTALTEDEMRATLQQLRTDVQGAQEAKAKEEGAANKKKGEEFLSANKSKDGVKALPDGLEYKVLKEGSGPKPTASDTVTVNYRGTLINGKEFDSSYKRGQPATFPVNGVIKGWTEALQLMPVGSKWELFIPPDLAYGDRGAGADIGPGETLVFEVELLSIGEQKK